MTTCPRCSAELRDDQSWCTECGLAARTRIAKTPNWRRPLATMTGVAAIAIAALAIAFFFITNDDAPVPGATTSTTPAEAAPNPAASSQTTPAPGQTTPAPGQTTTVPPQTAPVQTNTQPAITQQATP